MDEREKLFDEAEICLHSAIGTLEEIYNTCLNDEHIDCDMCKEKTDDVIDLLEDALVALRKLEKKM